MNNLNNEIIDKERQFHNAWADKHDERETLVYEPFYCQACPENRFILKQTGELRGKKVLELGAGHGTASVFFALCGADVTALDVSENMLEVAETLAKKYKTTIKTQASSADKLPFADETFDFVYAANLLHHVDTKACVLEVNRILKPGGKAAFWDPIQYNPIINIYRYMANQVRSEDEHPLKKSDIKFIRSSFHSSTVSYHWLLTLIIFLKFYFWDQIHPNEERYWKKIIYDFNQFAGIYRLLELFDRILLRIPVFQLLAWNIAIVATKKTSNN